MGKPIDEQTIMNDFLFSVVMRQKEYCIPLLEYILKIKIKDVSYAEDQKTMQSVVPTAKSIRLDVFVEDDQNTIYDLEVQTSNEYNLGKRSRYYQSMMDTRALEKGADYQDLKKSFVIFICNFDPFQSSRYVYTFRTRCDEVPDEILEDEATKIVINTKGTVGDISDELKAVLQYMDSGLVSSEYTKALDAEVQNVKADEKVRMSYMMLQEAYARERRAERRELLVNQIRGSMKLLSLADLAKILRVSDGNCKSVVDTINAHPTWDDEQVAKEIRWEK